MKPQRLVLGPEVERGRVDKVLARLCQGLSRATIQRWIEQGRVQIDGRPCRARDEVGRGNTIDVDPGETPSSEAVADDGVAFAVVFEDEDLLVVDKPAGLVVHPARGHRGGTLVNGLLARGAFQRLTLDPEDVKSSIRPGIVHRIDKDTSGLLVIAKTDEAREGLKLQLAQHSVERRYLAITLGVPRPGAIRTLHGRDRRSRLRFTSRVREGKPAVTHVRVLEALAGSRAALVECRLETGRTHQIRVHLLEQTSTPLLGDALYRRPGMPEELAPTAQKLSRQALHAAVLGFQHPRTGEQVRLESPLPADMLEALAELRALASKD